MQRVSCIAKQAADRRLAVFGRRLSTQPTANEEARPQHAQGAEPPITVLDSHAEALIHRRLSNALSHSPPAHMRFHWPKHATDAAVLMLLCTVNSRPSVLFEERDNKMATHGGEVCFAGGKADPDDPSLEHTALRETHEELGIPQSSIRVLGRLSPVPNKTMSLKVHTVVGVLSEPLDIRLLKVNKGEVHRAFTLPLAHFYDPEKQQVVQFRSSRGVRVPEYLSDKCGLKIWGLTGFLLHQVLCRIGNPEYDHPALARL
ncbi:hypothetical protein GGF43_003633 [Coemansia sp. RSA 2618]|nr:hypothetical protein GGF43_003633 [Coemansia sp. RSA 2618]